MTKSPSHQDILSACYEKAIVEFSADGGKSYLKSSLSKTQADRVSVIAEMAESKKGVMTVVVTSLTHKVFDPAQDVRCHQTQLPNGYSGRTVDTKSVTPFLKDVEFPHMAESGWLTRSLEQRHAYTLNYPGSIQPKALKDAFLKILHEIETGKADPKKYLIALFILLVKLRDEKKIKLAKPVDIPISKVLTYLQQHFVGPYAFSGAARLPVLAVYSAYQCMIEELKRFENMSLRHLEAHTTADDKSGAVGDIEVVGQDGMVYEAAEIKYVIKITTQWVRDSYQKFRIQPVKRYYILSTGGIDESEAKAIWDETASIKRSHGCEVVVNGVLESLSYYLRLLNNPNDFTNRYVENLEQDPDTKYEQKRRWNDIVGAG